MGVTYLWEILTSNAHCSERVPVRSLSRRTLAGFPPSPALRHLNSCLTDRTLCSLVAVDLSVWVMSAFSIDRQQSGACAASRSTVGNAKSGVAATATDVPLYLRNVLLRAVNLAVAGNNT